MFQLTVQSGPGKGATWNVTDKPIVLGRSYSCDIVIPDNVVSRRHCEIWLESGAAHIRDMGSSNATLVNGLPVVAGRLSAGDEIAVGPCSFLLGAAAGRVPRRSGPKPEAKTWSTVPLTAAHFLEQSDNDGDVLWVPRNVNDFRDLFLLNRRFSLGTGTERLLAIAAETIAKRFSPAELWFAWALPELKELVPHPGDERIAPAKTAPLDTMRAAVEQREGRLTVEPGADSKGPAREFVMAAPVLLGDTLVGAFALRSGLPFQTYDDNDLELFVAMADSLAPFLVAAGRDEQMRRDIKGLTKRAGVGSPVLGDSPAVNQFRQLCARAALTDLPVLILGETGVGKELAARSIHDQGERAQRPFVAVNCASIPRELLESELFGHEKGAFSGATRRRIGRFEEAHAGTLFLDEIGELPLEGQVAILRAVENGTFHRVGGERELQVNVRIVSATNRPIAQDVADGRFRADLYHRLSGFELHVPPLRDRKKDIPDLAGHFLHRAAASRGDQIIGIAPEAMSELVAWDWPGNVRELRLCIERAAALSEGPWIQPEDLVMKRIAPRESVESDAEPETLADAEKRHIAATLRCCGGNIRAASRVLNISRATLYAKIRAYGLGD